MPRENFENHEWRVHTNNPQVEGFISKLLLESGKKEVEPLVDGYLLGKSTKFFSIDFKIAQILEKKHPKTCIIQHRKPHVTKNLFSWVEWRGGTRRVTDGGRRLQDGQATRAEQKCQTSGFGK